MDGQINVAIIGLGRVGSTFIKKLNNFASRGISIVAVVEKSNDSPGLAFAREKGISILSHESDIVEMGDKVDVIFNLTGSTVVERSMKLAQVRKGNSHTVIVSRSVAELMWRLVTDETLPEHSNIID